MSDASLPGGWRAFEWTKMPISGRRSARHGGGVATRDPARATACTPARRHDGTFACATVICKMNTRPAACGDKSHPRRSAGSERADAWVQYIVLTAWWRTQPQRAQPISARMTSTNSTTLCPSTATRASAPCTSLSRRRSPSQRGRLDPVQTSLCTARSSAACRAAPYPSVECKRGGARTCGGGAE